MWDSMENQYHSSRLEMTDTLMINLLNEMDIKYIRLKSFRSAIIWNFKRALNDRVQSSSRRHQFSSNLQHDKNR